MIFFLLRGCFILLAACVIMLYLLPFQEAQRVEPVYFLMMVGVGVCFSVAVILIDVFTPRKKLNAISGVFLGLVAGLLAAYALSFVVDFVGLIIAPEQMRTERGAVYQLFKGAKVLIGLITCYLSISFVIQTKDDFRFVIPYVEFAKEIRGNRPILLDTSVLIDGRVADIAQTNLLQGTLMVPKFVLNELQAIADSPDKLRRARGRRGLDVVAKLQEVPGVDVIIDNTEAEGANVDQMLISRAQQLQARVMTNDYNLNKTASVRGIDVINLNDLAKAMRPVVLPGEAMTVKVIKPGEAPNQGVGYLDDGTMVVVENARHLQGQDVELLVTSTLQTSAGRMIFGRSADHNGDGQPRQRPHAGPAAEGAGRRPAESDGAASPEPPHPRPLGPTGRNPRRGQ